MKPTIGERRRHVFEAMASPGRQSLRTLAARLGLSKSSVHRYQQAMARRNPYPESCLWESEAGAAWLKRLVLAALLVFGLQRGLGCESLAAFFRLLRLERHVGVSVASLRKLQTQMETQILAYQRQHLPSPREGQGPVEVCASVDETFFGQTVLVMLDLASGFILVEEIAENHRYDTWQEHVQRVLTQLGLKVRYCVSDRAKALIKLALTDLECPSIADLFHALWEISQGVGRELSDQMFRVNRRLRQLAPDRTDLQEQLQAHLQTLPTWRRAYQLPDRTGCLAKVERQVQDLAAVVDLWWHWVHTSLRAQACDSITVAWVEQWLLPALYWQQQTARTDQPTLKTTYHQVAQQADVALHSHPFSQAMLPEHLTQWRDWAAWRVTKFQHASSPVEGRNGYLRQIHHNRCGLSPHRSRVLTTLHNFYLRRPDGSTAAERLFGQPSPDLFEWLLQHSPSLPQARQR